MPTLAIYGDSDGALGLQVWRGLDSIVTGAQVTVSTTNELSEVCNNTGDSDGALGPQVWKGLDCGRRPGVAPLYQRRSKKIWNSASRQIYGGSDGTLGAAAVERLGPHCDLRPGMLMFTEDY